jgi:ATP-dependent DNA helicase RecG
MLLATGDLLTLEKTREKGREKSSQKILVLIESNPIISAKEMAEKFGITSRSIEKHIKNLRDKGILRRVGPDKGGHWEIVE